MQIICDQGLKCLSIGAYLSCSDKTGLVGLGFDDGYREVLTVTLPILESFAFTATVFPVAGYLGGKNSWEPFFGGRNSHLSGSELAELVKAGFEIGSHTMTHPDLTRLSEDKIHYELNESKQILSETYGKAVEIISFPFSRVNRKIAEIARNLGYRWGIVLRRNAVVSDWIIRSLAVYKYETKGMFERKLKENLLELRRLDFMSFWANLSARTRGS